ncbi:BMP family ABC transporter substrate-binding protein [Brevibacillus massiliensis]|uniref:BMP family ABC transporter substrate-binding protein n=2 Tax=Brevibacillus massiliensis TaxID=1118054 RepID=UPI0002FB2FD8|nr:BMP family ABC transporter substrate-binding protein [Brevibacillus massiliensis]
MMKFIFRLPVLVVTVAVCLLFLTLLFLFNLNQIRSSNSISDNNVRIALLLEGPTYDQGWNSTALESLQQLADKYEFDLTVAANMKAEEIFSAATAFAKQGYNLVIGHGVVFSSPFTAAASRFPQTHFVTLNGTASYPNQTVIRYDMWSAGYLVGKFAAMMSKNHKVAYLSVDKPHETAQQEGFKAGVVSADDSTVAYVQKIPDFSSKDLAVQATRKLIQDGVDVIYTTGDSYNLPVITEAQKANIYVIGYISDQRFIAPNHVLTSLILDVNQVYENLIQRYLKDQLPTGEIYYGLAEGGVHLGPYGPMVPNSIKEKINFEIQRL